jgi:hypothetical protein
MTKLLPKNKRNYMKRGDKVQMKTGEILTVRSLEIRDFIADEKVGYIPKKTFTRLSIDAANAKLKGRGMDLNRAPLYGRSF